MAKQLPWWLRLRRGVKVGRNGRSDLDCAGPQASWWQWPGAKHRWHGRLCPRPMSDRWPEASSCWGQVQKLTMAPISFSRGRPHVLEPSSYVHVGRMPMTAGAPANSGGSSCRRAQVHRCLVRWLHADEGWPNAAGVQLPFWRSWDSGSEFCHQNRGNLKDCHDLRV